MWYLHETGHDQFVVSQHKHKSLIFSVALLHVTAPAWRIISSRSFDTVPRHEVIYG
jgi:hypothetical protein